MNPNLNPAAANVLVDPVAAALPLLVNAALFGDANVPSTLLLEDSSNPPCAPATRILSVGGPSLSLDELGPIVINSNGTTSRIENWSSLSFFEQANSHRRISTRNAERLAVLRSRPPATAATTTTTTTTNPPLQTVTTIVE